MKKILIIKLGYSETLDKEVNSIPSLGDILRTTPILWVLKNKFPQSQISWVVSDKATKLLIDNPLIDRIIIWDEFVGFQLMREKFDIVINLEKIAGLCALTDMIDSWTKYGFRFDTSSGMYSAYERGLVLLDYINGKQEIHEKRDFWQKILIEMMGSEWKEQEYILGYKPQSTVKYDIGFNNQVGQKWKTKSMGAHKWKELETSLTGLGYSVSWQEGVSDLYEYIEWINSCKVLVSHDSLGIHIAIALKKPFVGLFGSTDSSEIFLYNLGKAIHTHQKCSLMPCYLTKCHYDLDCLEEIDLHEVVDSVNELLKIHKIK